MIFTCAAGSYIDVVAKSLYWHQLTISNIKGRYLDVKKRLLKYDEMSRF